MPCLLLEVGEVRGIVMKHEDLLFSAEDLPLGYHAVSGAKSEPCNCCQNYRSKVST